MNNPPKTIFFSSALAFALLLSLNASITAATARGDKNIDIDYDNNENIPWKKSIPLTAVSAHGLPEGKLFLLLRERKIGDLIKLLNASPRHPGDENERLYWQGACFSTEKRYEQAVETLDRVKGLESAPSLVVARAARAYCEEQQFDKAIKLASPVIAKWNILEAYRTRVGAYASTDHFLEAARDYEKMATVNPYSARTYMVSAGNMLVKAGKIDEALTLMDRATKLHGGENNLGILMVKANCYKKSAQWPKAIEALSRVKDLAESRKDDGKDLNSANYYLMVALQERAACYDKIGKMQLAAIDRKQLETASRAVESELIGR